MCGCSISTVECRRSRQGIAYVETSRQPVRRMRYNAAASWLHSMLSASRHRMSAFFGRMVATRWGWASAPPDPREPGRMSSLALTRSASSAPVGRYWRPWHDRPASQASDGVTRHRHVKDGKPGHDEQRRRSLSRRVAAGIGQTLRKVADSSRRQWLAGRPLPIEPASADSALMPSQRAAPASRQGQCRE